MGRFTKLQRRRPLRSRRHTRMRTRTRRIQRGGQQNGVKAMVIVEPRELAYLRYVLENFHANMPKDWALYYFHGASKGAVAKQQVAGFEGRVIHVLPLKSDNLSPDEYNELFQSAEFWNKIDAEHILVFQSDTVLCSKSPKKIDDFLKYPYIGCSYSDTTIGEGAAWGPGTYFYGVGGLSLRKKSFMLKCIGKASTYSKRDAENARFGQCTHEEVLKPESAGVLAEFCTQDSFARHSLGAHKTWWQLNKAHRPAFYEYCPEAKRLDELIGIPPEKR